MSRIEARKRTGVHLNRNMRWKIRELLSRRYGNKCCWCDGEMHIPTKGIPVPESDLDDMATIEHYHAIEAGQPENLCLYRLAHKRCNK